jgi:hypothetical protein
MESWVKQSVLTAISDDYEDLDMVVNEVGKWGAQEGVSVTRQGITRALEELIGEGLAQAYVLSAQPPYAEVVRFSVEDVDRLCFYVTPKGKSLVRD